MVRRIGGRRRAAAAALLAVPLLLSGCVQLPTGDGATPTAVTDLEPLAELEAMELRAPEELGLVPDAESIAVLAADRSASCAISTKQGGIFDNPVDPIMAAGERDDIQLEVDAAYRELAAYPTPTEITADCSGTNLGFEGGTVMLTADALAYGGCRIGLTTREAEFAAGVEAGAGVIAKLPLLERGQAAELRGFRCGLGRDGMICAHLGTSEGFLANRDAVTAIG